jgi:hypothetical protein
MQENTQPRVQDDWSCLHPPVACHPHKAPLDCLQTKKTGSLSMWCCQYCHWSSTCVWWQLVHNVARPIWLVDVFPAITDAITKALSKLQLKIKYISVGSTLEIDCVVSGNIRWSCQGTITICSCYIGDSRVFWTKCLAFLLYTCAIPSHSFPERQRVKGGTETILEAGWRMSVTVWGEGLKGLCFCDFALHIWWAAWLSLLDLKRKKSHKNWGEKTGGWF